MWWTGYIWMIPSRASDFPAGSARPVFIKYSDARLIFFPLSHPPLQLKREREKKGRLERLSRVTQKVLIAFLFLSPLGRLPTATFSICGGLLISRTSLTSLPTPLDRAASGILSLSLATCRLNCFLFLLSSSSLLPSASAIDRFRRTTKMKRHRAAMVSKRRRARR